MDTPLAENDKEPQISAAESRDQLLSGILASDLAVEISADGTRALSVEGDEIQFAVRTGVVAGDDAVAEALEEATAGPFGTFKGTAT